MGRAQGCRDLEMCSLFPQNIYLIQRPAAIRSKCKCNFSYSLPIEDAASLKLIVYALKYLAPNWKTKSHFTEGKKIEVI